VPRRLDKRERKVIKRLFGPYARAVDISERAPRVIKVYTRDDPGVLGRWFDKEVWTLKERMGDQRLRVDIIKKNIGVEGLGLVSVELRYPHSPSLRVPPPEDWTYPVHPVNSPSEHETKAKYQIIGEHGPDHFHDNVDVKIKIRTPEGHVTYHRSDVDLLMNKGNER